MNRSKRTAAAIAVILFALLSSQTSYGGSGTASDPYENANIGYQWPNSQQVQNVYQDIQAINFLPNKINFWARNPNFAIRDGFYMGFQKNGTLKGDRNGDVVSRSAHFSLFGAQTFTYKRITADTCSYTADGGNGISCAIVYNWSNGGTYRVKTWMYYNVNFPAWCPAQTPNSCTVFQSKIGTPSNAVNQIGVWSIRQQTYGNTVNGFSFLEILNNGQCPPSGAPSGTFVIPFRKINGVNQPASATLGDDATSPTNSCAEWYVDWVVVRLTY